MAGGLFARIKNWRGTENLKTDDLNAEINNIIQNLKPAVFDDFQVNVSQKQLTQNPGDVGSEVLAQSLAEEIEQLRFQLNAIIGGSEWYNNPPSNLTILNAGVSGLTAQAPNRIVSGGTDIFGAASGQPFFLDQIDIAGTGITLIQSQPLVVYINNVSYTESGNLQVVGLTAAPGSNNTCLVNDAALTGTQSTKIQGERDTVITIGTIGANISSLNGQLAAFKVGTEMFLADVDTTNNRLRKCFRGFFSIASAWVPRVALNNTDTITLLKLTWIFYVNDGTNASSLDICYTNPKVSYSQPLSPAIGDFWLDLSVNKWKKYNGVAFVIANAVAIGACCQDSTGAVIGVRSFDFANFFNVLNTIEPAYVDANNVRSKTLSTEVSVYGTIVEYPYDYVKWSMSTDRDSGVSDSASTTYYLYVTPQGAVKISDVAPSVRKFDLLGDYHPAKPWRCIGEIANDGSSNFDAATISFIRYHQAVLPSTSGGVDNTIIDVLTIGATNIANSAITAPKIATDAVITVKIQDNAVTTAKIQDLNVTTAKINDAAVTTVKIADANVTRIKQEAFGQQLSSSSGSPASITNSSFQRPTNLVISITVSAANRMVFVGLVPDGSTNQSGILATSVGGTADWEFRRDASVLVTGSLPINSVYVPTGAFWAVDVAPGAGSHTYDFLVRSSSSAAVSVPYTKILVYEF